jgi:peptidoglycan/LPS O-acetylase OafA/YrhL
VKRIEVLESLRGILALWVVVGHGVMQAGLTGADLGVFRLVADPGLAVDGFIILSGFVISNLLHVKGTRYAPFIIGRFFRLAPLYFTVLLISAVTVGYQLAAAEALPWQSSAFIRNEIRVFQSTIDGFGPQLLAHMTLLHGLIPLPYGSYTFVAPAWSMSVEWQFYLVAPWLLGLAFARKWTVLSLVLLLLCVVRSLNYNGQGSAINQTVYFLVGIISWFLWRFVTIEAGMRNLVTVLGITLAYLLLRRWVSMALWAVMLANILSADAGGTSRVHRVLSHGLRWPPLLWLGKLSYSVYLNHSFVLFGVSSVLLAADPRPGRESFALILVPVTMVLTVILSWITHRLIEAPGIALGRDLLRPRQPD